VGTSHYIGIARYFPNTLLRCRRAHDPRAVWAVQNYSAQSPKKRSLQRLGKKIGHHLSGWTIIDPHLTISNSIGDKEVSNVDVPSSPSARSPTVLFQQHRTLIVLKDDIVMNFKTLPHQKISHPYDQGHAVIDSHQLCFS
jgi:hypothetical protein